MDQPPPYLPSIFSILPYIPFQLSNNPVHLMFVMIISLATRALDWPTSSISCWRGREEQVDSGTCFCGLSIRSRRVLSMAVSSKVASVYNHHPVKVWRARDSKALHNLSISWRWVVSFILWLLCHPWKDNLALTGKNKTIWVPEPVWNGKQREKSCLCQKSDLSCPAHKQFNRSNERVK